MKRFILSTLTILSGVIALAQNQQNTLPTSGNVGIGTTAPNCKLEVVGEAHVQGRTIVDSSLLVKDSVNFERDAKIDGNLSVGGDAYFNQDIRINGIITNPAIADPNEIRFVGVNSTGEYRGLSAEELTGSLYGKGCVSTDPNGGSGTIIPTWGSVPNNASTGASSYMFTGVPCGTRVGINTDSPDAYLTVESSTTTYDLLNIRDGNVRRLVVDANGNVGVNPSGSIPSDTRFYISNVGQNDNALLVTGANDDLMQLNGRGLLEVRELKVTLNSFSDYVFDDTYELISLEDLQEYINEHRHLPGIPSEEEILQNGANVNDLLVAHMAKIEELTLYIIAQEEQMKSQQDQIDELRREIELLKNQMNSDDE